MYNLHDISGPLEREELQFWRRVRGAHGQDVQDEPQGMQMGCGSVFASFLGRPGQLPRYFGHLFATAAREHGGCVERRQRASSAQGLVRLYGALDAALGRPGPVRKEGAGAGDATREDRSVPQ